MTVESSSSFLWILPLWRVKKISRGNPLKNVGRMCETRKFKRSAAVILKNIVLTSWSRSGTFFHDFSVKKPKFVIIFFNLGPALSSPQSQYKCIFFLHFCKNIALLNRLDLSRPNLKITPHIWEGHPWSFLYLPKRQYPYE